LQTCPLPQVQLTVLPVQGSVKLPHCPGVQALGVQHVPALPQVFPPDALLQLLVAPQFTG
jgi:hypothetical protein